MNVTSIQKFKLFFQDGTHSICLLLDISTAQEEARTQIWDWYTNLPLQIRPDYAFRKIPQTTTSFSTYLA